MILIGAHYTSRIVVAGRELKGIRVRLGLTQAQLAEAVGVTPNTVARWERSEISISEPIARLVRKIASEQPLSKGSN